MSQNTQVTSGGVGFSGLLGVLFIGLKLTGHITWPWVWVLCPLWIGPAILLSLLLVIGLICLAASIFNR